jgi:hypothetical protein
MWLTPFASLVIVGQIAAPHVESDEQSRKLGETTPSAVLHHGGMVNKADLYGSRERSEKGKRTKKR